MKFLFFSLLVILVSTTTLYSNTKNENISHAVVFMYHHFGEDKFTSTNIRLEQFKKQLDYLKENDYNVWPLSKIVQYVQYKRSIPPKTVALTIDDAYISIYTHAYLMLKEKGFAFTVFVNTNPIGHNSINYMTWEQMREMKLFGAEFANHSSTHDYLIPKKNETAEIWKKRLKTEIEDAQEVLQKELGSNTNENPKLLSYPFGEYTQESAEYIKSLGYIGVSQTSGVIGYDCDLRRVPRYAMSEAFGNMEDFVLKLNTLPLRVESAEPWNPVVTKNPPSLKVKLKKPMKNLACYTSSGKAIDIEWLSETEFKAQATSPLRGERDRYTCTAEDKKGRWYWYSHLWILDND